MVSSPSLTAKNGAARSFGISFFTDIAETYYYYSSYLFVHGFYIHKKIYLSK
jgi:hypothetical protein